MSYPNASLYLEERQRSGRALFNRVYGDKAEGMIRIMERAYPDICQFSIDMVYGAVYTPCKLITEIETELIAIAVLATRNIPKLLKGHLQGAINVGATETQVQAILKLAEKMQM
ncbi:hypothetical protein IWQ60_007708 [Tieghemiomyces parasiticus]|uniref:Carboxymuconolactone decarboxylase-like domain-containing protein n=1 Tax=Tieghemiomyces parasiticus TaxID=78921 RepID=A0A9W7ZVX1_9FUNG|nr:hypothetical protein IWQ60_007708 [Tieghemiomyces parasiticus]